MFLFRRLTMQERTCNKCHQTKDITAFNRDMSRGKDGYSVRCSACRNAAAVEARRKKQAPIPIPAIPRRLQRRSPVELIKTATKKESVSEAQKVVITSETEDLVDLINTLSEQSHFSLSFKDGTVRFQKHLHNETITRKGDILKDLKSILLHAAQA